MENQGGVDLDAQYDETKPEIVEEVISQTTATPSIVSESEEETQEQKKYLTWILVGAALAALYFFVIKK